MTIELLKQLIQCPSITPNDAGCQSILAARLNHLGFHSESMRFEEVDNLWSRLGTKAPLFVFAGHTDVVPTGPEKEWLSPPFSPEIRNENLYGRGACDMKAALAAMVIAVENFLQTTPKFNGSIAFLITSDEEGPALNGTKKVIEVLNNRHEKIDYCMVGEPSSHLKLGDRIRVGRRGSLHATVTIKGQQGHVANPHLAQNPIHDCALALHELAGTSWDKGNEFYPPTTFQITNIHGGTGAKNVIPGHLEFLCNFRYSTASTPAELRKHTESILEKHGLQFHIEWQVSAEPFLTQVLTQPGKLLKATETAIQAICKLSTERSTGGGTSDGRFIAATGAEVVELGVANATAHHINEYVRVADVDLLSKVYLKILQALFL